MKSLLRLVARFALRYAYEHVLNEGDLRKRTRRKPRSGVKGVEPPSDAPEATDEPSLL